MKNPNECRGCGGLTDGVYCPICEKRTFSERNYYRMGGPLPRMVVNRAAFANLTDEELRRVLAKGVREAFAIIAFDGE